MVFTGVNREGREEFLRFVGKLAEMDGDEDDEFFFFFFFFFFFLIGRTGGICDISGISRYQTATKCQYRNPCGATAWVTKKCIYKKILSPRS